MALSTSNLNKDSITNFALSAIASSQLNFYV